MQILTLAVPNGIPILDETNFCVGDLFCFYIPTRIHGIHVNRTTGPLMLLAINWDVRFALVVSLDRGTFLQVPLRYLIAFHGPLRPHHLRNRQSFFASQEHVLIEPPRTPINPPRYHAAIYQVMALEDDLQAAHDEDPVRPQYITRENYRNSHFSDLFRY